MINTAKSATVGKMSIKDKEKLLSSGAIFVCHMQGMLYMVFKVEVDEFPYCMEAYYHEEDYVCVYECSYASLELLEAQEPLKIEQFDIVYLLNAAPSSVPLSDIPMRSDIIQAVIHEAGLGWTVEDIQPYTLPDTISPEKQWQAWLTVLVRPMLGGNKATRFLLALHEPQQKAWLVLKPTAIVAPAQIVESLDEVQCSFFVPGKEEIDAWKTQEQSEGQPL